MNRNERIAALTVAAEDRVLILDGAAGTQIQELGLDEEGFRGERFASWDRPLKGNNDLLNLTLPTAIREMHGAYIGAGADLIETNTFSATTIAQADYAMEAIAP
ncbi:MAG: homocysteine S-methyltransferase family protein, partial [Pseudomonadota bacterium]